MHSLPANPSHGVLLAAMARGKHGLLLLALLIKHLLSPLTNNAEHGALLSFVLIVAVLGVGVRSVVRENRWLRFAFYTVFGLSAACFVASTRTGAQFLLLLALIGFSIIYLELIRVILADVLSPGRVDVDKIMGAVAAYMLIASLWSIFYVILNGWVPGSFEIEPDAAYQQRVVDEATGVETWAWKDDVRPVERIMAPNDDLAYFSFVTLTTLGYGEIVPIGNMARNMATLEAMLGPIYLAVLLARLVGLHTAQTGLKEP